MLRRLEYLLFVACIVLIALLAPKFLFSIQDRAGNQTVYAQYQEINISSVLVSNYIEDDAERYTTYLYRKSQGTRYEVMELEGSLSTGEIVTLLLKALYRVDDTGGYVYDFSEFFDESVMGLSSTQYAVYNAEDHSDIMFLATMITVYLDNGNPLISDDGNITTYDMIRVLVDSQTGALYFIGLYYMQNFYEEYEGLFLNNDAEAAAEVYSDLFSDLVFDMSNLSYADLTVMVIYPYVGEDWLVEGSRYAEPSVADYDYTEIGWSFELTQEDGFLTGVKFPVYEKRVDFYLSFAVKSPEEVPGAQESSYMTVTAVTQINTYEAEEYSKYGSNVCVGLWDLTSLFPEFNYRKGVG
ncbi:MAG: hypothetical protein LUE16_02790 [Lachnospiraceae bacterium]|nr:hypothetical protein [Lachnospiraceae bacterium]